VGSGTLYGSDSTSKTTKELDSRLEKHLKGYIIGNANHLVESIFHNENSVTSHSLNSLTTLYGDKTWCTPPPTKEHALASWFNNIGNTWSNHKGCPIRREWTASNCHKPLGGSELSRQPDLILLDTNASYADEPEWRHVQAFAEVTSRKAYNDRLRKTIYTKVMISMNAQENRRFFPYLAFYDQSSSFQFGICDRSGVVRSPKYNANSDALVLLRILDGLMFDDSPIIGRDPTVVQTLDNISLTIQVDTKEYKVIRTLFSPASLRGRATQCWLVKRDGQEYVIKDSWVKERCLPGELDIMKDISGIPCVPTFIAGEDLKQPGTTTTDSTSLRRVGIHLEEPRLHRRIVMQPVGYDIRSFTSKKELIGAFIDIVQGTFIHFAI
jgi:hypothetical protein